MRVPIKQGTEDWHIWRDGGIGASEIAAIAGCSPYLKAHELLDIKCGRRIPDEFPQFLADKGHRLEAIARAYVEGLIGEQLFQFCYQHDDYPFIRYSSDGITESESLLIEVKHVGAALWDRVNSEGYIPEHVEWQMVQGYACSGANKGIYCAVHTKTNQIATVMHERKESQVGACVDLCRDFMSKIENGETLPDPDAPIDMEGNNEFISAMATYFDLDEQIEALRKAQSEVKSVLIDLAGKRKAHCSLGSISSYERAGSLSYAKFIKDEGLKVPEKYRGKSSTVYKIGKASADTPAD